MVVVQGCAVPQYRIRIVPSTDYDSLPMFDEIVVDRLLLSLSRTELSDLMAFVPEEGRRVLIELTHAKKTGDLSPVQVAAHGLRGAAGNFGLARMEAIARAMNNKEATLEEMETLAPYLERCIDALDEELS